jgi:hypothetical protein
MRTKPSGGYLPLRPGARVLLQADPAPRQSQRYLRALAETVDFGGVTIAASRRLPVGSLVLLRLCFPPTAGDQAPFGARALVRSRRAWFCPTTISLQFLEFHGLGSRSLARCLDAILAAPAAPGTPCRSAVAVPPGRPRVARLHLLARWRPALLRHLGPGERPTLRSLP